MLGRRCPRRGSAWLWAQQEGGNMGSLSLICLVFDLAFGPCLDNRAVIPLGTLTIRASETQLQPGKIFILGNLILA